MLRTLFPAGASGSGHDEQHKDPESDEGMPQCENPWTGRPPSELLTLLRTGGADVPLEAAQEIVRRGDELLEPLCAIVADRRLWSDTETEAGWAPLHAAHLLGAIGNPAALPALLSAIWLDAARDLRIELPILVARMGSAAVSLLEQAVVERARDLEQREGMVQALYSIGCRHPESRQEIAGFLGRLLQDKRHADLRSALHDVLVLMDEPEARAAIEEALARGRIHEDDLDRDFMAWIQKRELFWEYDECTGDPMEHFSRFLPDYRREQQRAMEADAQSYGDPARRQDTPHDSTGSRKIGRNEPCPCGSGRKFKRCCRDRGNQPGRITNTRAH